MEDIHRRGLENLNVEVHLRTDNWKTIDAPFALFNLGRVIQGFKNPKLEQESREFFSNKWDKVEAILLSHSVKSPVVKCQPILRESNGV
jgi:hypothetical protein